MSKRSQGRGFTGHQNRLAHYFRNLYAAYSFIESSKLTRKEKLDLGKILRSKLSNYEQALLVLNIRSHLGNAWEEDAKLVNVYMPVKNVPEHFFEFHKEFEMKKQFSGVTFEWKKNQMCSALAGGRSVTAANSKAIRMNGAAPLFVKHAAAGPYLGFALQPVRLCYYLLSSPSDSSVSLEYLDDSSPLRGQYAAAGAMQKRSCAQPNF